MRKIVISWSDLCELLKKQNGWSQLSPDEEIKEITLIKPKQILIRTEPRS